MQGLRNAMGRVGLHKDSNTTRYDYSAKIMLKDLTIERLPEHLARGRLEPYLAVSRNDEKVSTHRTFTKKDWTLSSGLISYNETYEIDCNANDVLKLVLFNDAPILRPDQAVGEAIIPVRDLVTGGGATGTTGTTFQSGLSQGALVCDRALRVPINELLTSDKAGTSGTAGLAPPLGFVNLAIQVCRCGPNPTQGGGLTAQSGPATMGLKPGHAGMGPGVVAAGGVPGITPAMAADTMDAERNPHGITRDAGALHGGKHCINIFVESLMMDYATMERLYSWNRSDMDSKFKPYILVQPGYETKSSIKSGTFRREGADSNKLFLRDKLTVYANPTDQLYLYVVDSNFLGRDNYIGYCVLPCQDIIGGRRLSSVQELPLCACDPKNNKGGVPTASSSSFGNIGFITLRCEEGSLASSALPDAGSLTAIAGAQANLGAVPLIAAQRNEGIEQRSMQQSQQPATTTVAPMPASVSRVEKVETSTVSQQQQSTLSQQTSLPTSSPKVVQTSGQVYSEPQLGSGPAVMQGKVTQSTVLQSSNLQAQAPK